MLSQFNRATLIKIFLLCLILYNLWQLLQQTQLLFFLGYMILFLFYMGVALICCDLDILAFILWIVYGSFIVVIFIFSFMWINLKLFIRPSQLTNNINLFIIIVIIGTLFFSHISAHTDQWQILLINSWVNYYELAMLQNTEELECLGWGLSIENSLGTLIASILLTAASIVAIATVICAKRNKWLIQNFIIKFIKPKIGLQHTTNRAQRLYQQEKNNLLRANKTIKLFHRRRT